jgi:hypothetical protein
MRVRGGLSLPQVGGSFLLLEHAQTTQSFNNKRDVPKLLITLITMLKNSQTWSAASLAIGQTKAADGTFCVLHHA